MTTLEFNNLIKRAMNDCGALRLGQSFFSLLHDEYPELAEEIVGTKCDMFYEDENLYDFYTNYCENK